MLLLLLLLLFLLSLLLLLRSLLSVLLLLLQMLLLLLLLLLQWRHCSELLHDRTGGGADQQGRHVLIVGFAHTICTPAERQCPLKSRTKARKGR